MAGIYIPQLWQNTGSSSNANLSSYATKLYVDSTKVSKSGDLMEGILDLGGYKMVNIGYPEDDYDAVNREFINSNFIRNTGGVLTGNLNMDNNQIKNLVAPTDNKDVANKRYVDNQPRITDIDRIGRYIQFTNAAGIKNYVSVRAKKGIHLENGKIVELKNNFTNTTTFQISANIEITSDFESLPAGKTLGILNVRDVVNMQFNNYNKKINPFSVLLSFKLSGVVEFPFHFMYIVLSGRSEPYLWIRFSFISASEVSISIRRTVNGEYSEIHRDNLAEDELSHLAFSYEENESCFYLNGRVCGGGVLENLDGKMFIININNPLHLGIFSLYDRKLDRNEVIEHYVDNHVSNFTHDKVII